MVCVAQYSFLLSYLGLTYSILFNTLLGHAIGPYPIAGPKGSQTRHHPLRPGQAYSEIPGVVTPEATSGLEVSPEKQAALSPELAAAIAAGIIPPPQWGAGGSIVTEPNDAAWNNLLLPSGQHITSSGVPADSPVVQEIFGKAEVSIVLGVIYSGIFGPSIWLSFTARTALMRHWYSALLGGTSVLLLCAQREQITSRMWKLRFIAFIVAKIVAAPAGMFFFKRPSLGWILGVVWASALTTKIVEVFTGWFQGFFFPAICFCGVAIVSELLMKEVTQAVLTAFGCSYLAIASTSFFLTLFGFQPNAPLDLLSFWTVTPNTWTSFTQASAIPYSLLGLWGTLLTFGFVIQLLRTRQGYTIPFISIAQRFLPLSPTAADEKD